MIRCLQYSIGTVRRFSPSRVLVAPASTIRHVRSSDTTRLKSAKSFRTPCSVLSDCRLVSTTLQVAPGTARGGGVDDDGRGSNEGGGRESDAPFRLSAFLLSAPDALALDLVSQQPLNLLGGDTGPW